MVGVTKEIAKAYLANWPLVLRIWLACLSLLAFVDAWAMFSAWLRADWPFEWTSPSPETAAYVPYPWDVIGAFFDSFVTRDPAQGLYMGQHIIASLKRILAGFSIALALGVPAGLLIGRSWGAEAVGRPLVEIFRPIPPLAWIPIFLIVFGLTWGPIAIVFLGVFFPILLNTIFGAKAVDPILIDAARTLGAKRMDIFVKVVLPFTMPYIMAGITVGLGIGWMCIVAAEMLGGVGGGVGYYIFSSSGYSRYDYMYAGMLVIGLLSIMTTGVAGILSQRLNKWMGME